MKGKNPIPQHLQSEAAFIGKQRELKQLHHQLQLVLQDMNRVAPIIEKNFGLDEDIEEEEDLDEFLALNKTEISSEQEIRLLIREIQQLQGDVQEVQSALLERCKGNKKVRITAMVQQLMELEHILDGQLYRAEKLIG